METITRNIPVLALRGLTAFPGQTVSFDAERDISIFALDNAMENDRRLLAMTQKDLSMAEPGEEDLYTIGTVCHILQIIKTSDTTVRVIAEGESRARLHRLWQKKPFLQAQAELLPEMAQLPPDTRADTTDRSMVFFLPAGIPLALCLLLTGCSIPMARHAERCAAPGPLWCCWCWGSSAA